MTTETLLEVQNLKTYFSTPDGLVKAVDDVSFHVRRGKTLGVVGESGCGKTITAFSILQLVPPPGKIIGGDIYYYSDRKKINISKLPLHSREMRNIRGNEIAMIYQEPMTALCPVYTVGNQIMESVMLHQGVDKKEAERRTIEMLSRVGISVPAQRVNEYPYELSGGMRQRAMIAMALCCNPSLLIADEPTTALDVTIQAQILTLLRELQEELKMTVIIITHNLGVIGELSDDVMVMYLGKIVEYSDVHTVFHNPQHPYTLGLFNSIPLINPEGKKRLIPIKGSVPDIREMPSGCVFTPRCSSAKEQCQQDPPMIETEPGHKVRCWLYQ